MRKRLKNLGVRDTTTKVRDHGIDRRPSPFEHRFPAEDATTLLDGAGSSHAAKRSVPGGRSYLVEVDDLRDDALPRVTAADPRPVLEADEHHAGVGRPPEFAKGVWDGRRSVRFDDAAHDSDRLPPLSELVDDTKLDELREPIDTDVAGGGTVVNPRLNKADPLPGCELLHTHADERCGAFDR